MLNCFYSFIDILYKVSKPLLYLTIPVAIWAAGSQCTLLIDLFGAPSTLYILFVSSITSIITGLYYHFCNNKGSTLAQAVILAGFSMLYLSCYQLYSMQIMAPEELFFIVIGINTITLLCSKAINNVSVAIVAVTSALCLPSLFLETLMTKHLLNIYLITVLAITLLFSYLANWIYLNFFTICGYILYNPLLLQKISMEPKSGTLSVNELLWSMGWLFAIFTLIPLFYSLWSKKERLFESISITLVGAYSFATLRYIAESKLQAIKDIPFFIKLFIHETPTITDIDTQLFFTYLLVYFCLLCLAVIINRKAKLIITTLTNLCFLSIFGLLYVHSFTAELISYLYSLHQTIINLLT